MIAARDFEMLVHRYLDNVATPEDILELNSLLKSTPELADLFVEVTGTDFLFEQLCEEQIDRSASGVGVKKRTSEDRQKMKRLQQKSSHPRRTSRWGMWISIAACLAIIVGAHLINRRQTEQFIDVLVAHIQETAPNVKVIRGADGRVVSAIVGMELFPGDRIEAKKGEKVVFAYLNEKTSVTAGDGKRASALVIGTVGKGKRLRLVVGVIAASVAPQSEHKAFVVETPHARAKVIGTEFSLCAAGAATWLDVKKGLVELTRLDDGKSVTVGAGRMAVAGEKAEAFALKTYAAGTEWVDGPVILAEDFENGLDLEKWTWGSDEAFPGDRLVLNNIIASRSEELRPFLHEGPDGKQTHVLGIRGIKHKGKRYMLYFHLVDRIDGSYSITYDSLYLADKGEVLLDSKRVPGKSGRFIRQRTELICLPGSDPEKTVVEIIRHIDGEISTSDRYVLTKAELIAQTGRSGIGSKNLELRMLYDNIVVRRLVKK